MAKKLFFLWVILLCGVISFDSLAQINGDYRTNGVGTNWGTAANWDRHNGTTWVAGVSYPGQAATIAGTTVTIQNGHNMILNVNVTGANSIANLIIGGGASGSLTLGINTNNSYTLTCSGAVSITAGGSLLSRVDTDGTHTLNFQSTLVNNGTINFAAGTEQVTMTVTGTTTNNGTMTFGINTGVKTFIGAVSNTGTWTSTTLATTGNLVFRNGVSSTGGTFAAGGATFDTNTPRSIGGTAAMSFSGIVTIGAGITITNDNTSTLTLSNTGVALASGGAGSNFTQGTTTNTLSYAGSSIGVVTFDATGANNTVIYSAGGGSSNTRCQLR